MELVEFIPFCQSFLPSLCHIFTPHFAFLEKIINKEYPDCAQDDGRQALDGRLPALFKPHKGGDGLQGASRGGSSIGDSLSDSRGYGDDRIDHVAGHCFNGSIPAFSKLVC